MTHNRTVAISSRGQDICHADAVPTDQSPAQGPPSPAVVPPSVRVAAIVMGVLAALLLTNAALSWFGMTAIVDRVVEEGDRSRDDVQRVLVQSIVLYLVLGALIALSAWFLPRRQPWARWVGLAATVALALLTIVSVLAAGGVTIYSLLLLVLAVAAVTSLLARTTGAWVPSLRTPT